MLHLLQGLIQVRRNSTPTLWEFRFGTSSKLASYFFLHSMVELEDIVTGLTSYHDSIHTQKSFTNRKTGRVMRPARNLLPQIRKRNLKLHSWLGCQSSAGISVQQGHCAPDTCLWCCQSIACFSSSLSCTRGIQTHLPRAQLNPHATSKILCNACLAF
jgi:hypothetical protein